MDDREFFKKLYSELLETKAASIPSENMSDSNLDLL